MRWGIFSKPFTSLRIPSPTRTNGSLDILNYEVIFTGFPKKEIKYINNMALVACLITPAEAE